MDVGCATQDYIEAGLNENTSSLAAPPGATAGTGRPGRPRATTPPVPRAGYEDPQVDVPGNHSAALRRPEYATGHPATADPDSEPTPPAGGTLAAGTARYAVTDQFNGTGTDGRPGPTAGPGGGQSHRRTGFWGYDVCRGTPAPPPRPGRPGGREHRPRPRPRRWSLVGSLATPGVGHAGPTTARATHPALDSPARPAPGRRSDHTDTGAAGPRRSSAWTPPCAAPTSCPGQNYTPAGGGDRRALRPQEPQPAHRRVRHRVPATPGRATRRARQFVDGTALGRAAAPGQRLLQRLDRGAGAGRVQHAVPVAQGGQCDTSTTVCLTAPATVPGRRQPGRVADVQSC